MKYVIFDIHEILKNSHIGKATIVSNLLEGFRNETHCNFIILETNEFKEEGNFVARLINDTLFLCNGENGKVNPVKGDICVFTPDDHFQTLRTGWICQIDFNKIKEENPSNGSFFVSCDKPGPACWEKASFDIDGTIDFGKDVMKGSALIDSF